ncbi:MAG: M24 family metallopeptidase [Thermaerobacterales bacterium]
MGTRAARDERDARIQKIREAMAEENLDALIIAGKGHWWTGRGYFRYLTDFHLWGHDGLILLPLSGDPLLTVTSAGVAAKIAQRGWISDARPDWDIAPRLIEAVKERRLAGKRLGLVGRRFILSVGTYEQLVEGLPDADWVAADHLFDRIRAIKSPLEIQQNYELWDLAKAAQERFAEALEPGRTERDMASEVLKVCYAGGARDHLVFYNRRIPEDQPVNLADIVAFHLELCNESGHWCELNITLAFRDPTADEQRKMESELRAYDEIRKIARPGATLRELSDTFGRVLAEDGWEVTDDVVDHYDFHGHGLDVIEWPRYGPTESRYDTELQAGMIFSYHPSRVARPAVRMMGVNENLLIAGEGGIRLSQGTSGVPWDQRWRTVS